MASLVERAQKAGVRITRQRIIICDALEASHDHPDVNGLLERARGVDRTISLSSVYRTMRALEGVNLVTKHDFGDGRARWEVRANCHHDHLICIETGQVIEFADPELEALKRRIAKRLGYRLEDHKLELYGRARR
ncbi:MAG: Fur family transcriptional regulator [Pseudomonadota bacterium]